MAACGLAAGDVKDVTENAADRRARHVNDIEGFAVVHRGRAQSAAAMAAKLMEKAGRRRMRIQDPEAAGAIFGVARHG